MSSYVNFKLESKMQDPDLVEKSLDHLSINHKREEDNFLLTNVSGYRNMTLKKEKNSYSIDGTHDQDFSNIRIGMLEVKKPKELLDSISSVYNVLQTEQNLILKYGFSSVANSFKIENGFVEAKVLRSN